MKIIDSQRLEALSRKADITERGRLNDNLHPILEDPVQRFLNAMRPRTYVRPHRHTDPPRWELFLALRGRVGILLFDDLGKVLERTEIAEHGPRQGAEIEAGCWHALVALQPAVLFELKQGPYSPSTDKDFAPWAPAEGDKTCSCWVHWYTRARPGDRFTTTDHGAAGPA